MTQVLAAPGSIAFDWEENWRTTPGWIRLTPEHPWDPFRATDSTDWERRAAAVRQEVALAQMDSRVTLTIRDAQGLLDLMTDPVKYTLGTSAPPAGLPSKIPPDTGAFRYHFGEPEGGVAGVHPGSVYARQLRTGRRGSHL